MARKRYPSDDKALRQRPHVKVHLSTRSHPRYGEVFENPESRGIVWGLWLLAVQYHAAQTNDEVALGFGDLVWLTGRTHRPSALKSLRTACELMDYSVRTEGKRVLVQIRNLQRKQGFHSTTPPETPGTPDPSEVQKNQGTKEPRNQYKEAAPKTPPPAPAGAPVSVKSRTSAGTTLAPESLEPDDLEKLTEWAALQGLSLDACAHAWGRVHDWSHTGRKKRARWWIVTKNAMQDGWALKGFGGGRGPPSSATPKTFNQLEEDANATWLNKRLHRIEAGDQSPDRGLGSGIPKPGLRLAQGDRGDEH